jgi:hypothetical protein
MAQTMSTAEIQRRAIHRALALGGAALVQRVRFGLYRVESATRPGTFHTVSVDAAGHYRCTCEAGVSGRACWHQASVFIAKAEANNKGWRVTGPAAPAPELPANVVPLRPAA